MSRVVAVAIWGSREDQSGCDKWVNMLCVQSGGKYIVDRGRAQIKAWKWFISNEEYYKPKVRV